MKTSNGAKMEDAPLAKKIKLEINGSSNCGSCATGNIRGNAEKIDAMNSLGLEERAQSSNSKNKLNGASTSVKKGEVRNTQKIDTNALIERFVSTLNSLITASENKKIIERFYGLRRKCQEKYLCSKDFEFRISSSLENIHRDPSNMYVYIKEVYDEMKLYRNRSTQTNGHETETFTLESESLEAKNRKQIKNLKRMLSKLDKSIQELKTEEMTLDEMDDNCTAYIYEDRLMKRYMKVWRELSKLKKRSHRLENNVDKKFHYTASRYPELNKQVEQFLNSSKKFPDYSDILDIAKTVNETSSLGLSGAALHSTAQNIFHDVGRELQRRRLTDYQCLIGLYLTDDVEMKEDPAESDVSLRESLEHSYREGQNKLQKVLSDFTEKQATLKLEPKEVGDINLAENDFSDSDDEEDKAIEQEQIEEEMYSDEEVLSSDKSHSISEKVSSEDDDSEDERNSSECETGSC